MLNIKILCVGKIKEKSLVSLIDEYLKRLSKYCKVEIITIDDEKVPSSLSMQEEKKIKDIEGMKLKQKIEKYDNASIFYLDLKGTEFTSEEFATEIQNVATYSSSTIIFVIGGTLGLSDELFKIPSKKICFSKMTFPHQLIRLFLLEQIFRAFKIQNNETYHH